MVLNDKVAIITGASRGIGEEIARLFAANGADLVLVGRNAERLSDLAKWILRTFGREPFIVIADIADTNQLEEVVNQSIKRFGRLDILVNSAGSISREHFSEFSMDDYHYLLKVNLHAPIYLSHLILPHMRSAGGGCIVNVTSQMSRLPHPNAAIGYEVSKAGLAAATRHIAFHYSQFNIRTNSIAPGSIETDMLMSMNSEVRSQMKSRIPIQCFGSPRDVANAALFLASPQSCYITGATIDVNGGSWMP
jgi:3-oxoacyl-[acyl-carrier protein] reductase